MTAIINGGAIPEVFDYRVLLEPEGHFIGTLNEDFAIESLPGDVFQLGNTSWRILRIGNGVVRVADAQGQPPSMPFWLGEAPARSDEMSAAVSRLRAAVDVELPGPDEPRKDGELDAAHRVARARLAPVALGRRADRELPRRRRSAASASCRPSTRSRSSASSTSPAACSSCCTRRSAAASTARGASRCARSSARASTSSCRPRRPRRASSSRSAPRIRSRSRRCSATCIRTRSRETLHAGDPAVADLRDALALEHDARARRAAQPRRRARARTSCSACTREDLLQAVFPDAAACQDNIPGAREVPDHPLVNQALRDCARGSGRPAGPRAQLGASTPAKSAVARDTPEPSVLCHELLNSAVYTFLDDAPLEERRTRAVYTRRATELRNADDLGALDPAAIERVREEAWPVANTPDEMYDALMVAGYMTQDASCAPRLALVDRAARRARGEARRSVVRARAQGRRAARAHREPRWKCWAR